MLVEYVKDNNYAMFHNPSHNRYRETRFNILLDVKVNCAGSWCMLVEYAKDIYYAMFRNPTHQRIEKPTLVFSQRKLLTKSMEPEM